MVGMLNVERWPELRDPVMVIALTGWVDGGLAGAGTMAAIAEQLESVGRFGRYELANELDLQQTRPTVKLADGVTREIDWPAVDLVAGRLGRDVVLCAGPEPSLHWRTFTEDLVGVAQKVGATMAVGLGGMPAVVSHRRPVRVLATATSRSLAQEVGAMRADYSGPTGVQTVLQVALGQAGIPSLGLWAQVPHYVSGNPSPPAIRALLERLRDVAGVQAVLDGLDAQTDDYLQKVEEGLHDRPDVADMVRAIEAQAEDELPTGDDLAAEIERFLRRND
jgi:proteasome assembly chaperone (PAC2) family protein